MSTATSRSLRNPLRDLTDAPRDPRHERAHPPPPRLHDPLPAIALVATSPGPLARARARIALAERAGRAFPPRAVVLGFKYFAGGGVAVLEAGERTLRADVKGKRTQHVELHVEGGTLAASCTCGASTMGPSACRHVWAALLEVDRRDMFAALRGTRAPMALVAATATASVEETAPKSAPPKRKSAESKTGKPKTGAAERKKHPRTDGAAKRRAGAVSDRRDRPA
jgi:hypothetical protein